MSINVEGVDFSAGGRIILDGVSIAVEKGKVLGLLGPNGSGKSSLLRAICRLGKLSSGVVRLGKENAAGLSRAALARRVGFVQQQSTTDTQLTVEEIVRLGRTPHRGLLSPWNAEDTAAVENALVRVDMWEMRAHLWQTLSGGERQRVHIARALAQTPSELLLDEPTNHLDIQHQLEILALISELDVTCVVALHDLNLAAMFCDSIAVLQAGRVVAAGTPVEVLTRDLIADVFRVQAHVEKSETPGRCHIRYLASRQPDT